MSRKMNWKSWVILGLAVAVLATSGTLVMASNMGFKINKQIYNGYVSAQAPKRVNWISVPYSSPYANMKSLCQAMGTTSASVLVYQLNPVTGVGAQMYCNSLLAPALDATKGVRVTSTLTGTTPPTNVVLVGASDETKPLPTILGGFSLAGTPKKENWISVPYHTTWLNSGDVCTSLGLLSGQGSIIRINGDPTAASNTISYTCGGLVKFNLVMGEALLVRKNTAGDITGKLPPHF